MAFFSPRKSQLCQYQWQYISAVQAHSGLRSTASGNRKSNDYPQIIHYIGHQSTGYDGLFSFEVMSLPRSPARCCVSVVCQWIGWLNDSKAPFTERIETVLRPVGAVTLGLRSVSKQFANVSQQSRTRDRKFCKKFAKVSILNRSLVFSQSKSVSVPED